ncbi:MAG: signal recognition particle-docking protein FtsY, partial [Simkaniaceae bacterium]|nr:signal recognition particle-docking protein FtsY [Simkaniaceae bacterium]
VKKELNKNKDLTPDQIIHLLKEKAKLILNDIKEPLKEEPSSPKMILIVGVNGSGKTTSIAKLAYRFQKKKQKVLLAAGDTFRAAATEQLEIWAKRTKTEIVKGIPGGDPSSVIFDALTAAKARGLDLVLADTAGRLQSKTELMEELAKIKRVSDKVIPGAPHEIYLVLDATTGQNAVDQAKIFNEFTPLTGLILTKLDGSAKGGVILSIYHQMGIPVKYIGVGEQMDDLVPFNVENYIEALFAK